MSWLWPLIMQFAWYNTCIDILSVFHIAHWQVKLVHEDIISYRGTVGHSLWRGMEPQECHSCVQSAWTGECHKLLHISFSWFTSADIFSDNDKLQGEWRFPKELFQQLLDNWPNLLWTACGWRGLWRYYSITAVCVIYKSWLRRIHRVTMIHIIYTLIDAIFSKVVYT